MARYQADENQVLFQYESGTYAATSGTGQWIGLVTEHNIVDSENIQQLRFLGTATRNVDQQVLGPLDHEGTITYHPQDWKFLGFTLGSNVDSGSPSPYIHTFTEANSSDGYAFTSGTQNPFASFTIEDSQTSTATGLNFVRTAKGCVVDSFELSVAEGEPITATVNYRAQSVAFSSGAKTAVTEATTRPFLWQDIKVHIPSGTVFNEVASMTLSVNNNLNAPHFLNGSRVIAPPQPENRDYNVALELQGTSERTKTLFDQYFRGGSSFNMFIEATAADAGAGSRDIFMSFSGCRITEMDAPSSAEGTNMQSLTIVPLSMSAVVNDLIQLYNPW